MVVVVFTERKVNVQNDDTSNDPNATSGSEIVELIERARLAQQSHEQKHDVQLELPAQWLVLDCVYNRMWYPTLVNTIVVGNPPAYAAVHRIG